MTSQLRTLSPAQPVQTQAHPTPTRVARRKAQVDQGGIASDAPSSNPYASGWSLLTGSNGRVVATQAVPNGKALQLLPPRGQTAGLKNITLQGLSCYGPPTFKITPYYVDTEGGCYIANGTGQAYDVSDHFISSNATNVNCGGNGLQLGQFAPMAVLRLQDYIAGDAKDGLCTWTTFTTQAEANEVILAAAATPFPTSVTTALFWAQVMPTTTRDSSSTTSAANLPAATGHHGGGVSPEGVVGIVVGVAVLLAGGAVLARFLWLRHKNQNSTNQGNQNTQSSSWSWLGLGRSNPRSTNQGTRSNDVELGDVAARSDDERPSSLDIGTVVVEHSVV